VRWVLSVCFLPPENIGDKSVSSVKLWQAAGNQIVAVSMLHFRRCPTGSGFDQSLWVYSGAPPVAFYIDDIWIRLSRRGVKRYVVPASAMMRSVSRQRRTVSLSKIPVVRNSTMKRSRFFATLGTSSFRTKHAGVWNAYGAATTEHRRLPKKRQRW
jgi:hypothetical protein